MKKLFLLFGLLVSALNLSAQCTFFIEDKTVRPGEVSYVTVMYELDEGVTSTGYTLFITIPEGITPYTTDDNENGGYDVESYNGDGCEGWSLATNYKDGTYRFLSFSFGAGDLPSGKHSLVVFPVKVSEDVAPGTELKIESAQIDLSLSSDGNTETFHPLPFSAIYTVAGADDMTNVVQMYDNYASFDEFPKPEGDVDVCVYRTFKAGNWSTLVVPFNMDARRINSAFGDDVQIAQFSSFTRSKDGSTVKRIDLQFTDVEEMKANTPYIIKVSKDMTEFYANSVKVVPEEYPDAIVTIKEGRPTVTAHFYGSYFLDVVPADNLYIQNNLFYYSTGNTNIKGFRGFFEVEGASADANLGFMVNDEVTSINDLQIKKEEVVDGDIYSISGQNVGKDVNRLQRGVYIVNGKKFVKK